MKIGEYEVTSITRDSAMVGCQRVTRGEAEALLASMKVASEKPQFSIGQGSTPGSVWLSKYNDGVRLYYRNKEGNQYYLLDLTPEGIVRAPYCNGSGFPVENVEGKTPEALVVKS